MSEVIATFGATDGWHERADLAAQTTNSSLGDPSQKCFEFAERHLDRVKVRRILRQILHCCTSSLDCVLHAMNFVGRKVVYHHDVVALECRCQALLDIGHERCSVDWPVEDHRCHHPVASYQESLAAESSADALAPRRRGVARLLAGFFLNVMPWRSRNRQSALRLPGIRRLCIAITSSSSVRSGCSSMSARMRSA